MATKKKVEQKVNIPVFVVAAMIIIGVLSGIIAFVSNSKKPELPSAYIFSEDVVNGIDVSEHNKYIDWELVKESQQFAFIRVGYRAYGNGEVYEDKRAIENLQNANDAGIPIGVYFYSQAITEDEAIEEADFVYNIIKKYKIDLPVMFDFEYATNEKGKLAGRLYEAQNDKKTNTDIINAFTSRLQKRGYQVGVYASSSVFYRNIDTDKLIDGTVIWCADYNGTVTYKVDYDIWQYSEKGSVDGVESKHVDLNYWYTDK